MPLRDFALLVAVCGLWAFNNIVSKLVVSDLGAPPLLYAALRFGVVAAITLPWLLPAPRPLWRVVVVALLMGGGNFAIFFVGLKSSTPSSAAVVLQLGVPMTTILSWLILGEKLHWRRGLGIALTFGGAMLVMWNPHGIALTTGLVYVAIAAFMGSLGAVMMKQVEGIKPLQFQAWVGFSSLVPLIALTLIFEPGGYKAALAGGWMLAAAIVFSAVVVSVVAHTAYYGLIQRHDANLISPLTLMTPLATILLGVLVTHDPFGVRMAIGTAMALIGVLIIALRPNQVMPMLLAIRNRDQ
ncbi:MAG: DMT family transporter [Phenylobacterium sp.]